MQKISYKTLRRVRVILSVVLMALLTFAIIDIVACITPIGKWLINMQLIPAILSSSAIWLILWVILTMCIGRVYCSSICPLGTLQDCAAHLGRRFSTGAGKRYSYSPPQNMLRMSIPVIVAACFFLGINKIVVYTDPYSVYERIVLAIVRPATITITGLALAMLLFFLIAAVAWRKGRIICNTVCPAGGFLGMLSRYPVYNVDINTDKCVNCDKCVDVCKSSCIMIKDHVVDNSRCVMCLNCTAVCPNDAITIRRGRHQLSIPMFQPLPGPAMNTTPEPAAPPTPESDSKPDSGISDHAQNHRARHSDHQQ